jgi:hypothetical protein
MKLMVNFLFAGMLFAAANSTSAQANIEFNKMVHDYGTIEQSSDGSNGICEFTLKNTGNEALIIADARGSCSCTVPDWPKDPIAPGASAVIRVKYDTRRVGPINKQVTITSNGSAEPVILRIKGTVTASRAPEKPSGGAPSAN